MPVWLNYKFNKKDEWIPDLVMIWNDNIAIMYLQLQVLVFAVIAAILILISSSLVAHDVSFSTDYIIHPFLASYFNKVRAGVVSIVAC